MIEHQWPNEAKGKRNHGFVGGEDAHDEVARREKHKAGYDGAGECEGIAGMGSSCNGGDIALAPIVGYFDGSAGTKGIVNHEAQVAEGEYDLIGSQRGSPKPAHHNEGKGENATFEPHLQ